ncbi:uncharacterized protein LOC144445853 [Glandiceps talaboti]
MNVQQFLSLVAVFTGSIYCSALTNSDGISITLTPDGQYSITINNKTWLNSGPTFFNIEGSMFTSADKSLKLINITNPSSGSDVLGRFELQTLIWQASAKSGTKTIRTSVRVYQDISAIVFAQYFPEELEGTSINWSNGVCTGFPSFKIEGKKGEKGFLSFGGLFLETTDMGGWHDGIVGIEDGLYGGPLALFDNALNTVVISSFTEFMAGSHHLQLPGNYISYGIMGNASMIPKDFNYQTIVYYGQGVNQAIYEWGDVLLRYYGKTKAAMKSDLMVNYLGYYTDNGKFLFYYCVITF